MKIKALILFLSLFATFGASAYYLTKEQRETITTAAKKEIIIANCADITYEDAEDIRGRSYWDIYKAIGPGYPITITQLVMGEIKKVKEKGFEQEVRNRLEYFCSNSLLN